MEGTEGARIPEDLRTITASEAAELLDTSAWQIYQWARRGVIPSIRMGRSVRFRIGALRAWMEQQERVALGDARGEA